ncbi:MAG: H-NS histone family protein [Alphaproteobacteria bacterium]|nr:H-NS histone family protein [Alphaproteobacteria bacterium]
MLKEFRGESFRRNAAMLTQKKNSLLDKVKAGARGAWYYSSLKNSRDRGAANTEVGVRRANQMVLFEADGNCDPASDIARSETNNQNTCNRGPDMIFSSSELENLSVEEISALYTRIRLVLVKRIENEKSKLEETLSSLNDGWSSDGQKSRRRKYPPVIPKYRNPADNSETWAGRGKQPRWVVAQLRAGKKMEDFIINRQDRPE